MNIFPLKQSTTARHSSSHNITESRLNDYKCAITEATTMNSRTNEFSYNIHLQPSLRGWSQHTCLKYRIYCRDGVLESKLFLPGELKVGRHTWCFSCWVYFRIQFGKFSFRNIGQKLKMAAPVIHYISSHELLSTFLPCRFYSWHLTVHNWLAYYLIVRLRLFSYSQSLQSSNAGHNNLVFPDG